MSWTLYRWIWEVTTPLYLGRPPAGSLNRTRLYVPARTVWGALTAELARHEASLSKPEYTKLGDELHKSARFSYLFPAEREAGKWQAWLPAYRAGEGLVWELEHRNERKEPVHDRFFRRRVLHARPGTAIDPQNDSALDGSLRDTECVQTLWRRDDGTPGGPVAMVGYVFFPSESNLEERLSAITTLFVGGDTRYGLGRIDRVSMDSPTRLFDGSVDLGHGEPRISTARLVAHAYAGCGIALSGDQEVVSGWDSREGQGLHHISGPAWMPGTVCGDSATPTWELLSTGMLKTTIPDKPRRSRQQYRTTSAGSPPSGHATGG